MCLYFIAIFLPFLPVLIRRGCGADLLINICLDILGWIPGGGSPDAPSRCELTLQSYTVGGLLASLRSGPGQWVERMVAGRIRRVSGKRCDGVVGWEMGVGGDVVLWRVMVAVERLLN